MILKFYVKNVAFSFSHLFMENILIDALKEKNNCKKTFLKNKIAVLINLSRNIYTYWWATIKLFRK